MKRLKNAYPKLCDFENLYNGHKAARLCKRYKPEVLRFEYELNRNVEALRRELERGIWRIGGYREFVVHEPKRRVILSIS